jgi:hypothetical protein
MALGFSPGRHVRIVGVGRADAMVIDQDAVGVKPEMSNVNISKIVWREECFLQGTQIQKVCLMERYVSLLEERIRLLEETQSTKTAIAEQGDSISHRTINNPKPAIVEQHPVSPTSLNDGVLDLENSEAFEHCELGTIESIIIP